MKRCFDDADTVRWARQTFDDANYTLDAISERLGPHAFAHLSAGELAPLERSTRTMDRLDILVRLFLLGTPVTAAQARAALAPLPVEAWAAGGMVAIDGHDVRGCLTIRPLGDPDNRLVAHDRPRPPGTVTPDHVLGVSASTTALAGATVRRPIERAFDLGTGCGVQAVHAATHAARVVACDLNPRAVALATLTMELNGLDDRVDVRLGDRFDPVAGEEFELIVANPPFVISPSRRYLFRDSGLPVDEVCRSIVRSAPEHLTVGGHCQLLASWAHIVGEDWRDRVGAWFAGTDCDALVLEREALDPGAHVASWLRQTETPDGWGEHFDAWIDYCDGHRIEAVAFGLITMRKRDGGPAWFRAEEATQDLAMPCGDHLGAVFELADFLHERDDAALLDEVFRVGPDVVLDERALPGDGGWAVTDRRLRQMTGLRYDGEVDPAVAAIVAACDGRQALGQLLASAAVAAGVADGEVEAAALPIVRRLVERAFLLPAVADA